MSNGTVTAVKTVEDEHVAEANGEALAELALEEQELDKPESEMTDKETDEALAESMSKND